jgi:DNA-binding protein HU-beta
MAELKTKDNMVKGLVQNTGLNKKDVDLLLLELAKFIIENLKQGNSVRLPDLGTLKPTERKARNGRNPQTGETMLIPAKRSVGFTAAKSLKDALNNGK